MSEVKSPTASLVPGHLATWVGRAAAIAALMLFMVGWLRAMGRPWLCPCGTVEFWQGA